MKSHTVPRFLPDQFAYDDPKTKSRRLWQYAKGRAPSGRRRRLRQPGSTNTSQTRRMRNEKHNSRPNWIRNSKIQFANS